MWLLLFRYISPGTIYESDDSKTDPNLYSNPNPNGHRKPYRLYEGGESKTDPNLNCNPIHRKVTVTLTLTLIISLNKP